MPPVEHPAACTCPPGQPENVTDARCPQHGIFAFLASGAVDQPDDPPAASTLRGLVDLTGVRGYTSWKDEERGCEAVSLETHEALVDDYMALGQAADALLDEIAKERTDV